MRRWFEMQLRSLWCHCNEISCRDLTTDVYGESGQNNTWAEWNTGENATLGLNHIVEHAGKMEHYVCRKKYARSGWVYCCLSVISVIGQRSGVTYWDQTWHYSDVIMGAVASQITSLTIVYSTVYPDADQRKHQSSASLAFVRRIHRGPVNSPHKRPVTRKMFPFDDVIMETTTLYISHKNSISPFSWIFIYQLTQVPVLTALKI